MGHGTTKITVVLIMDLLAAFDTVNHSLLLHILERKFGITNTVLKWYKNFLKPRKFKVCINGSYSSEWILAFGLSKGSTPGVYLFSFQSIKSMQKIQNTAARLILEKNARESTTECLTTLHWLLIQQRIDYKICTHIHKCCKGKLYHIFKI